MKVTAVLQLEATRSGPWIVDKEDQRVIITTNMSAKGTTGRLQGDNANCDRGGSVAP